MIIMGSVLLYETPDYYINDLMDRESYKTDRILD